VLFVSRAIENVIDWDGKLTFVTGLCWFLEISVPILFGEGSIQDETMFSMTGSPKM
jgi:hypothetical protein